MTIQEEKQKMVKTSFMDLYIPDNMHYEETTYLSTYMGERDVDMIQSTLECYQSLSEGKRHPKQRLCRVRKLELEIKQPLFSKLS